MSNPSLELPLIRRTFPELITDKIVGVQPMGEPIGICYALRGIYNDNEHSFDIEAEPQTLIYRDWNNICE